MYIIANEQSFLFMVPVKQFFRAGLQCRNCCVCLGAINQWIILYKWESNLTESDFDNQAN